MQEKSTGVGSSPLWSITTLRSIRTQPFMTFGAQLSIQTNCHAFQFFQFSLLWMPIRVWCTHVPLHLVKRLKYESPMCHSASILQLNSGNNLDSIALDPPDLLDAFFSSFSLFFETLMKETKKKQKPRKVGYRRNLLSAFLVFCSVPREGLVSSSGNWSQKPFFMGIISFCTVASACYVKEKTLYSVNASNQVVAFEAQGWVFLICKRNGCGLASWIYVYLAKRFRWSRKKLKLFSLGAYTICIRLLFQRWCRAISTLLDSPSETQSHKIWVFWKNTSIWSLFLFI